MNTFIQENRKLLKFYHIALLLAGWVLLILGVSYYPITIFLIGDSFFEAHPIFRLSMVGASFQLVAVGFLGFGIAQLIQFLFDRRPKPGFILRHGSKFLYIYLILALIRMAMTNALLMENWLGAGAGYATSTFWRFVFSIVIFAAKALILVGVSQFLRRLTPIMEEHKSLI